MKLCRATCPDSRLSPRRGPYRFMAPALLRRTTALRAVPLADVFMNSFGAVERRCLHEVLVDGRNLPLIARAAPSQMVRLPFTQSHTSSDARCDNRDATAATTAVFCREWN
jgi:hypothetical protein